MKNTYTLENPLPPPWIMYPNIPPRSIGWRMGYGEFYIFTFCDWFKSLSKDEQNIYQDMFPEPKKTWHWFYTGDIKEYLEETSDETRKIDYLDNNEEQKYSKEFFIKKEQQKENLEFVFFWAAGDINYEPECCFSQFQYSEFKEFVPYTCAEQFMMSKKAMIFGDKKIENEILNSTSPKQMKLLGRKVKNFDEKIWDDIKYKVVTLGNYYKFSQNKRMRDILLATGDKVIVEASPLDRIWGIGLSKSNEDAINIKAWRGLNLLGFALMEVRDELREVYKNYDKIDWSNLYDETDWGIFDNNF